jgi:hypothetical protein
VARVVEQAVLVVLADGHQAVRHRRPNRRAQLGQVNDGRCPTTTHLAPDRFD